MVHGVGGVNQPYDQNKTNKHADYTHKAQQEVKQYINDITQYYAQMIKQIEQQYSSTNPGLCKYLTTKLEAQESQAVKEMQTDLGKIKQKDTNAKIKDLVAKAAFLKTGFCSIDVSNFDNAATLQYDIDQRSGTLAGELKDLENEINNINKQAEQQQSLINQLERRIAQDKSTDPADLATAKALLSDAEEKMGNLAQKQADLAKDAKGISQAQSKIENIQADASQAMHDLMNGGSASQAIQELQKDDAKLQSWGPAGFKDLVNQTMSDVHSAQNDINTVKGDVSDVEKLIHYTPTPRTPASHKPKHGKHPGKKHNKKV